MPEDLNDPEARDVARLAEKLGLTVTYLDVCTSTGTWTASTFLRTPIFVSERTELKETGMRMYAYYLSLQHIDINELDL